MNANANGSKYRNIKTQIDGLTFASKKEAHRYGELKLLERQGLLFDLKVQVPFEFRHNDVLICRYYADFQYRDAVKGGGKRTVVEDVKGGKRTKEYIIKKKLMRAFYGIEILET